MTDKVANMFVNTVITKQPAQFKSMVSSALQQKALNKITSQAKIIGKNMFKSRN